MPGSRLESRLRAGRVVLGDGAMGTMLQQAGLTDGGAPELWNVTSPERVGAVYRAYVAAGSELIETNTFGGSAARLRLHGLQARVVELSRAGARLACEVAHPAGVLVAGSIGPTGELIEPVGPLAVADAAALFAEQAIGLRDGGVDCVVIETMSHLNEVRAAIDGVRRVAPGLPIVATMSFDTNRHTMMGVSPRQAVEALAGWGLTVVGANCGTGTGDTEAVAVQMARYRPAGVFLMVQSNAGMPRYADGRIAYDGTPEVLADHAVRMRSLGVDIVGACCGSTPAHIAAMRAALARAQDDPVIGPPAEEEGGGRIESAESRATRAAARRSARRREVSG